MDNPWPLYIVVPWVAVFFLCCFGYIYLRYKKNRTTMYGWDLIMEFDESTEKKPEEKEVVEKKDPKEKKKKEKKETKKNK